MKQKRALRNNSESRTELSNWKMVYVNSIHRYISIANRGKPEKSIQDRRFSGTSSSDYSHLINKNFSFKIQLNSNLCLWEYTYMCSSLDCERDVAESRRQSRDVSHCHIMKLNQSLNRPLTGKRLATGDFFLRHIHVLIHTREREHGSCIRI